MIDSVATAGHDQWLKGYRAENGDKPRIKTTKDQAWIVKNGTDQVNIAVDYSLLPSDWQKENRLNAEVATDLVLDAASALAPLSDRFIETASSVVHDKWLERNSGWATEVQKLPYPELPEEEKEKDRFFVRAALDAYRG